MDWHSVWQGVISNGIYALFILGGGIVLAVLKKKDSRWFKPATWGLIGAGLAAVIVVAFVALTRMPKPLPGITPDNVEASLRTWLDNFELSSKKIDDPQSIFALVITLDNGTHLVASRPKTLDRYLLFSSSVSFGQEDNALLARMPKEESDQLKLRISAELVKARVEYSMDALNTITILRRIPITENVTEDTVMHTVDAINFDKLLVLQTIYLTLHGQPSNASR